MTTLRFPVAGAWGAVCAVALFALLAHLVNVPMDVPKSLDERIVDFTTVRSETPVEPKRPTKPTRETPPVTPGPFKITTVTDIGPSTKISPTWIPVHTDGGGFRRMGTDRDVQPIVRVNPEYPQNVIARGIEGWVKVQFTITATGGVKDAFVVDASPGSVFDAAALKAIARWRYNPRIEGGTAVERVGMQTVIRFELENSL